MLFIIPGFPFITSGIDLAKLDMRSGLERLAYAVLIILVATMTAWIMAAASPFCWAVASLRCCVPSAVQASATLCGAS